VIETNSQHPVRKAAGTWPVLRGPGHLAIGLLLGVCIVMTLAMVSGLALSRERLQHLVSDWLASGQAQWDTHHEEDYFTECSLLTMSYVRRDNVWLNLIQTQFFLDGGHPCEDLRALVARTLPSSGEVHPAGPYVNYPFGSRYLEAVALSVLNIRQTKILYSILSYGSVVCLFLGAWRNSRRNSPIVFWIGLFLLFGFAMHHFGNNPGHAPGFFVGFAALGIFLAARDRFRNPANRTIFFGCLGILIAFFDLLHGSIPVMLSLGIVLNHLFYVSPAAQDTARRSPAAYSLLAVRQAVMVFACFLVAYVLFTGVRLLLLSSYIVGVWNAYAAGLGPRLGHEISGRGIDVGDAFHHLWLTRFQLTPGGVVPSTWMLYVSATAWVFTLCLIPIVCWRRGRDALVLLTDLLIVAVAAAGALAWYRLFLQHTYIHVLFVVRIVALPAACGLVAATIVVRSLAEIRASATRWAMAAAALVSLATVAWLLEGSVPVVTAARFVREAGADRVSCAPVGLKGDGKPDRLIVLALRTLQVSPPLALLGLRPRSDTPLYLRLERAHPGGWWETGNQNWVLGVTLEPAGPLMNRPDGTFALPRGQRLRRLWLHYCADDHDTPESSFSVSAGETVIVEDPV
jgi:hypothetical protein